MKRISLLSAFVLMNFYVSAYGDYYPPISLKYRLHYSPYTQGLVPGEYRYRPYGLKYDTAGLTSRHLQYTPYGLEYGKNSMVCDNVEYSPYALKYNSSSLVPRYTRYSPYLLSYNSSGLIYDTGYVCSGGYSNSDINVMTRVNPEYYSSDNYMFESFSEYAEAISKEETSARKAALEERRIQIEKNKQEKADDPSEAIRQILVSKKINFNTSHYLRIDGKTISVSFVIEDANIIIKFWNSKEISEFAENDENKKCIYQNYLKSWEDYCLNNIGSSKKIYNIISGDREDIFKQLSENSDLKSSNTLYAQLQNQSPKNQ